MTLNMKRRYDWKQWVRKHGNKYISSPEEFWDLLQEKRNSKQAIEYGVAEPGTLIAEGMSIWNFLYLYFGPASYRDFGHHWCVKLDTGGDRKYGIKRDRNYCC